MSHVLEEKDLESDCEKWYLWGKSRVQAKSSKMEPLGTHGERVQRLASCRVGVRSPLRDCKVRQVWLARGLQCRLLSKKGKICLV